MGAEVKWSFEELGVQSRKAANVLGGVCGLQPGDRMMLVLPRLPEWWLVSVACMRTGQWAKLRFPSGADTPCWGFAVFTRFGR